jgi:exopolysaccharide biosynthesis WecB/TagA/CpsF family protein
MAFDTLNFMRFTGPTSAIGSRVALDKTRRDYAVFLNGLLLLLDFFGLLAATYIATEIYAAWFAGAAIDDLWSQSRVPAIVAVLAAVLLYDKRFISVASRGHTGALIRCYLTGFAMFVGGVAVVGSASGALRMVTTDIIATWLAIGFVLTALTRVALAVTVQWCVRKGLLVETVAIVGKGARAERLARCLRQTKPIAPRLLGIFDDDATTPLGVVRSSGHVSAPPLAGSVDDLIELGKVCSIDWIFLALPQMDEGKLLSVVNKLKALSVPVALCPQNLEPDSPHKMIDFIGSDMPVMLLQQPLPGWRAKLKVVGQFLPRWITTLVVLSAMFAGAIWNRLSAAFAPNRKKKIDKLVCKIDNYDLDRFVRLAEGYGQQRYGYVVTPNADHLIRLHDDATFYRLYAAAEYVLMDSRFIANVLRVATGIRLPVCPGSDLTAQLFDNMAPTDRVVLIGGSEEQAAMLATRYGLRNLAHHNPPMGFIRDEAAVTACLDFIEAHSPFRFCLLAIGSPQQEIIAEQLHARGVARGLALCVGASIDFLTGVERRAPDWMQRHGVEWLYRLLQNPARLASRYLIRGPRIFWLLRRTKFILRSKPVEVAAGKDSVAARAA